MREHAANSIAVPHPGCPRNLVVLNLAICTPHLSGVGLSSLLAGPCGSSGRERVASSKVLRGIEHITRCIMVGAYPLHGYTDAHRRLPDQARASFSETWQRVMPRTRVQCVHPHKCRSQGEHMHDHCTSPLYQAHV